MKFQKNTFLNYLTSYIIILTIPTLILGYISYSHFLGFYIDTLQRNKINSLSRVKSVIDLQITQLNSYAYRMSNSQEFSTTYLKESFSQFYDLFKSISNIKFSNDFLHEVIYLNKDLGYTYTANTRYTYENFKAYGSSYDNYDAQQSKKMFEDLQSIMWLPVQPVQRNSYQVLSYFVPIKFEHNIVHTAAIFQINKSTLDRLAGDIILEKNAYVLITDKHNSILYSSNGQIPEMSQQFWDIVNGAPKSEPTKIKLNGKDILLYSTDSEVSGIKYISLIPYEELIEPLNTLKIVFLFGILTVAFLGSFVIFFFMRKNYSPLYALGQMAKSFLPTTQAELSEVEAARQALESISESNKTILTKNNKLIKEELILKLLRDGYNDTASFDAEACEVGIILSGPAFRVAVLAVSHTNDLKNDFLLSYEQIIRHIEDIMKSEFEAYGIEYREDNSIILLLSGDSSELNNIDKKLTLLQSILKNEFNLSCTIGVGNICNQLHKTNSSYIEARTSAKYQFVKGKDAIIFFEKLAQIAVIEYSYPTDEITALYNAISYGDIGRIEFAIDMLVKSLSHTGSLFFAICLAYDIVNTALRAMRELNYSFSSFRKKYPEILLKSEFKSPEEIVDIVKKLSVEISDYIKSEGKVDPSVKVEESNIEQIIRYIEQHYTEETFSAKTLSDHFGMSISNFSHYFKSRTGHIVSEHINYLRFEKVKELLISTDLTIAEIVKMSGYCHVSTLMRQFKQIEGMTPSTYRNMHRPLIKNTD